MRRQTVARRVFVPITAVVLGCVIAGALLWHSKSGAEAGQATKVRRPVVVTAHAHPVIFGISDPTLIHESGKVQATQLARMRSIGITAIRLDANWDWVQFGGPTSFYWTQLDREVHSALAAKMRVLLVVDGCPPWAAPPGTSHDSAPRPASATQFAAWAGDVASRYGPQGVKDYEIWNEPNDTKFWQPRANPAFYTTMLKDSYRAIKRVEPSAFVIAGGLAPVTTHRGSISSISFLRAMYAHGAKGYFDAVTLHPYSFPALPDSYESWSAWSQMSATNPSIRSVMRSHGDARIPIWITEFGAPSNGPSGVGASGEAAELSQGITISKATSWIGALFVYTWEDAGTSTKSDADWFGLLTNRDRTKAAYWAVKRAIARKA
jgi:polysaccharide biosynthesis protein PslG